MGDGDTQQGVGLTLTRSSDPGWVVGADFEIMSGSAEGRLTVQAGLRMGGWGLCLSLLLLQ